MCLAGSFLFYCENVTIVNGRNKSLGEMCVEGNMEG